MLNLHWPLTLAVVSVGWAVSFVVSDRMALHRAERTVEPFHEAPLPLTFGQDALRYMHVVHHHVSADVPDDAAQADLVAWVLGEVPGAEGVFEPVRMRVRYADRIANTMEEGVPPAGCEGVSVSGNEEGVASPSTVWSSGKPSTERT
jgi:hypothetical protein